MFRLIIVYMLLSSFAGKAFAACPSWLSSARFQYLASGAEVADLRTGLIWSRCSLGQRYENGTCAGEALTFYGVDAVRAVAKLDGWRLPSRRELFSLFDPGCAYPSIDNSVFPNTPSDYFFSSSSAYGGAGFWYVSFARGDLGAQGKDAHVRLVRMVSVVPKP